MKLQTALTQITEDDVARLYLGRSSPINDIEVTPIDFKEDTALALDSPAKVLKKNPLPYWTDRQVLESAGIPILARTNSPELFDELPQNRCDGITRAVYEVRDELLGRPLDESDFDPYLLMAYQAS
jgi:hypothetical protein